MTPELELSLRHCRTTTRHHAKSFYFASIALPREKKDAAYAVYAFCRYADDVVDETPDDAPAALAKIESEYDRMTAGNTSDPPFAPAFAWAVQRYNVPKEPFMELLEGVARDQGRVRIATWEELRDYCWHVASTVGLMMARIFELRDERGVERAVELGIAMQLTNILRDIREDYARDRIYLPAEELARFGVAESDLAANRLTPEITALLRFQIDRAREFYRSSEMGIPLLADDGSQYTVWLMRHVYAGILDAIEAQGLDVFSQRASTSTPRKLVLAAKAWRDWRRTRK